MNNFARMMAGGTLDYTQILTSMLYDEPCVMSAVAALQAHCLRHGVILRWGHRVPTPSFQRHISEYYEPFCRDAILSFLTVGFAPFRLRKEGNNTVPELLPFGTYTWNVARTKQAKRPRGNTEPMHNPPLLRYDVISSHCDDPIHVFNFCPPQANLNCTSPLASCITHYLTLLSLRESAKRAEDWNSRVNLALEEKDDRSLNDMINSGGGIPSTHAGYYASMDDNARHARNESLLSYVDTQKDQGQMDKEAKVAVLPKNNVVRSLEKIDPPPDMPERELQFARAVALSLGIPASFAMQVLPFHTPFFITCLKQRRRRGPLALEARPPPAAAAGTRGPRSSPAA